MILSPTLQKGQVQPGDGEGGDPPQESQESIGGGQDGGGGAQPRRGRPAGGSRRPEQEAGDDIQSGVTSSVENRSYNCKYHKKSTECDVCSHMIETKSIMSRHFQVKHAISGHNVHLPAAQQQKLRWTLCVGYNMWAQQIP